MPRRKTVKLNLAITLPLIKSIFRSNVVFCEKMGRTSGKWVSDWCRNPPKNLPSPEEAARMCLLLNTTPEDILTEPADIDLVNGLIEAERAKHSIKKDLPQGEVGEAKRILLETVYELSEKQCKNLLGIVLEAKKIL